MVTNMLHALLIVLTLVVGVFAGMKVPNRAKSVFGLFVLAAVGYTVAIGFAIADSYSSDDLRELFALTGPSEHSAPLNMVAIGYMGTVGGIVAAIRRRAARRKG
jgi:lysylphosphatidylglycerol synthetase-like protein (DUF2156 family)